MQLNCKLPMLLLLLCAGMIQAQTYDLNNFTPLKSEGPLPDDFTVKSSEKFQQDVSNVEGSNKREQKDLESFLLESNFQIEDILHSGRIIYGDPVTTYLNKIKDEILRANPDIKQDIRIYTLLSNEVNAFTFDNGIVIVTTGLVAQVQNEAQLAFILCHEFVHYDKKHSITGYVENRKVERGSGVYSSLSKDEEDLVKFRFAKEQETEADELGLTYYANTKYSYATIEGVFDVLLYSYLPIDEIAFSRTYFSDQYYVIPSKMYLDTLTAIEAEEDYDDETATHPNIKKRKANVLSRIPEAVDTERIDFLMPVEDFKTVQALARFQGCDLYLNDVEYENALYQAYVLQQMYPENDYLKTVVAQSLYGWAMYKNAGSSPEWHQHYKKIQGESQQVYYFFSKMSSKEMLVLALRHTWERHLAHPENQLFYAMSKDLGYQLAAEQDVAYTDFLTQKEIDKEIKAALEKADTTNVASDSSAQTIDTKNPNTSSKYDKIKGDKGKEKGSTPTAATAYWKYAFPKYLNDPKFTALIDAPDEDDEEDEDDDEKNPLYTVKRHRIEYHLGLKEVVVVDPVFISVDERSDNPVEYIAAEEARVLLRDNIKQYANKLGMQVTYLDHSNLNDRDVEDFNDMAILSRWIHESLAHLDEEVTMQNSSNAELQALAQKYGVDHFAWMGIVSFTERETRVGLKIAMCIYIPIAPFLIYDLVTPDKSTFFFSLVANAETGAFEMQYFSLNDLSNSKSVQSSNMYFMLEQMAADQKK